MLFLEPWFWTFAAAAVVGFLLLPQALRIWWLLASSVIFYLHFGGVGGVLVVTILATLCGDADGSRRLAPPRHGAQSASRYNQAPTPRHARP